MTIHRPASRHAYSTDRGPADRSTTVRNSFYVYSLSCAAHLALLGYEVVPRTFPERLRLACPHRGACRGAEVPHDLKVLADVHRETTASRAYPDGHAGDPASDDWAIKRARRAQTEKDGEDTA